MTTIIAGSAMPFLWNSLTGLTAGIVWERYRSKDLPSGLPHPQPNTTEIVLSVICAVAAVAISLF